MQTAVSQRFQQLISANLPDAVPIMFDAETAVHLIERIDTVRLHAHPRMLYELLLLGETEPQVICFVLEQEVNYYVFAQYNVSVRGHTKSVPTFDL